MKGKHFYLGIAICYFIVAIIQFQMPGTLNANLYVTIAFVSLELSLLQILKSLVQTLKRNISEKHRLIKNYSDILKRNIKLFEPYKSLDGYTQLFRSKLKDIPEQDNHEAMINKLDKLDFALTFFQLVFCTIQMIIMPLKIIPFDALTNKTINVLTIITFAFMFLSYYFTSDEKERRDSMKERLSIEENLSNYFFDVIESINKETEQKGVE